jgi:phage terminase small subunit
MEQISIFQQYAYCTNNDQFLKVKTHINDHTIIVKNNKIKNPTAE